MKLWLELSFGDPVLLYTKIPDTKADIHLLEYDGDGLPPESLYIVHDRPRGHHLFDRPRDHHLFNELVDALHYAMKNEVRPASVWHCWVDKFNDPDEFSISQLTMLPIKYIANLEISYRIYNPNMTSVEAFQEAVAIWKMFGSEDNKILKQLIDRYPDFYAKTYEQHLRQHDLLMSPTEWTSLSEFMDAAYPSPRPLS